MRWQRAAAGRFTLQNCAGSKVEARLRIPLTLVEVAHFSMTAGGSPEFAGDS